MFERFTRATYREKFGVEAPAYDPSRPIKRWFDSTALEVTRRAAADEPVLYEVHDPGSEYGLVSITMTRGYAASVNLPGAMVYPKYAPKPTPAWINGPTSSMPFPVQYLCEAHQAEAIAREILGEVPELKQSLPDGLYTVVWAGETRRPWGFDAAGSFVYAESLRLLKFAQGVGAPGKWIIEGTAGPRWLPDRGETGEHDLRPEVPIPIRELAWNERLERGLGGVWRVRRTDLLADQASKDAQWARLLWLMEQVAKRLGVEG